MEFLFFIFGAIVGAIVGGLVVFAIMCILAVGAGIYNKDKGDNQECTNQEQK